MTLPVLKIGSRKSPLAMAQSEYAASILKHIHRGLNCEIIPFQTLGDTFLEKPLQDIGGKGLFVKELERALLEGEIHLAVHSMKDMPPDLPDGLALLPFAKREDPRDAFISKHFDSLDAMPAGAIIGTSSLRRQALLKHHYPQLETRLLRGNVNTRLSKLDTSEPASEIAERYDAIILASAGLKRLGLQVRITQYLEAEQFVPACGQGILAVEFPAHLGWLREALTETMDYETQQCWQAESALQKAVSGTCHTPLGAYAKRCQVNQFELTGFLASEDLKTFAQASITFPAAQAVASAEALSVTLREQLTRAN